MKILEKINKIDEKNSSYPNQVNINDINGRNSRNISNPIDFQRNNNLNNRYTFQDYQKNHLSQFFDLNDASLRNPNQINNAFNESFDENKKKMIELKKERYSLKKTLKELETKFENGIISDVDYFRTYKKLQKDIYSIEKKIEKLKEDLNEELFLRRNYHKSKYTF